MVQPKYLINSDNFKSGYVTTDDHWDNRWRKGANQLLGFDAALPGPGTGAKSMGQELAHSDAFAQCQVEKVFKAVCLREPGNAADRATVQIDQEQVQDQRLQVEAGVCRCRHLLHGRLGREP